MATEWAELDEEAWRIFGGLHRLLLRLAGRFPDELLSHARAMLGQGDLAYLPDTVTGAAVGLGVSMAPAEVDLLRHVVEALGDGGEPPSGADQVPLSEVVPATDHRFAPAPPAVLASAGARIPASLDLTGEPGADLDNLDDLDDLDDLRDELTDLTDDLVVDALSEHAGVVAIWRTWRFGPAGPPDGGQRVYLAEVEPGVRAWELTLDAQRELVQMDVEAPQVEVFWTGDELPPYHRAARDHAALLWNRP
ncbi:hypothetical protein [Microtetraspora sp. NBRC 16547]|uniref:hypothetical protein n=1 Tax=Microtetraspora sp. NBRC 16547 TaxID=3030993 RepID=UPI0024A4A46A|nr:hypothetical protein [Microtetraspora sp. NBRC 16547]GLX00107.1 hypothetical protein Misp02_41930 [Microtetraspora sp. NBRC 16547]